MFFMFLISLIRNFTKIDFLQNYFHYNNNYNKKNKISFFLLKERYYFKCIIAL